MTTDEIVTKLSAKMVDFIQKNKDDILEFLKHDLNSVQQMFGASMLMCQIQDKTAEYIDGTVYSSCDVNK